jgi:hypothetical protein
MAIVMASAMKGRTCSAVGAYWAALIVLFGFSTTPPQMRLSA